MDIEGTYTFQAPPELVWRNLMDPQILRKSVPGVERLEQIDDHTYEISLTVQHVPLRGTYQGRIQIVEQQYPSHYRISFQGESQQQVFGGNGDIYLQRHENHTVISYQGLLNIDRHNSLLPPTLIRGMMKLLVQQFFAALAEDLYVTTEQGNAAVIEGANGSIVILPAPPLKASLLRRAIHQLGLGAGGPEEEIRWEARIRRVSLIAGLLLLIWVGTRLLPRRQATGSS